jgi:hypothetical protein
MLGHVSLQKVRVMLLGGSDTGLVKLQIRIALFGRDVYILYVPKIAQD